jgi:P27 family predicted phage terminase small subunit
MNTLATADRRTIELACNAYADLAQASQLLAQKGLTYDSSTPTGIICRPRPEVAIRADSWKRFLKALSELGMTPLSRGRIQVAIPIEEIDPVTAVQDKIQPRSSCL